MPRIRPARPADFARMQAIEVDAGQAFGEIGMPEIAADDPDSIDALERFRQAGQAWVAVDDDDVPVAYLVSEVIDGCPHVSQVSVARAHAGRGIGAALIDHASEAAKAAGCAGVTLTTFAGVPWNAPYYERLGFQVIDRDELGPELRALLEHEEASIPGDAPRVAMRRLVNRGRVSSPVRAG